MATYIVNTQSSNLNVRKEPNTKCDIIGKLAKGTEVEVEDINDGWATISFNGERGFASMDYLKAKEVTKASINSMRL